MYELPRDTQRYSKDIWMSLGVSLDVFGSVFGCLGVSLDVFGSVLGCLWGVFRCLWVIHRFVGQVWEQPGLLCVFQVFSVSRDTQSNLGFSQSNPGFPRTKPLFPDEVTRPEDGETE